MSVRVIHGDCLEVLAGMPEASVDAVVTDPPYHLTSIVKRFGKEGAAPAKSNGATGVYGRAAAGFMGKTWDGGDIAFRPETWAAVMRVMKPGAFLIAMGGTRTYHRLACAIEDAGFEIRDSILSMHGEGGVPGLAWTYGGGFPKHRNALKPSWEPIVLARRPLSEPTVAAQVLATGTGGLNIDATRVPTTDKLGGGAEAKTTSAQKGNEGWTRPWMDDQAAQAEHAARVRANVVKAEQMGRWPPNCLTDGSPEVRAAFEVFGEREARGGKPRDKRGTQGVCFGAGLEAGGARTVHNDTGTAARFFPALGFSPDELRFNYSGKASKSDRAGSKHPTIKPQSLLRWLARLCCPPGGVILDPFAGSGSLGTAALAEGFSAILIEKEEEHYRDCLARLEAWCPEPPPKQPRQRAARPRAKATQPAAAVRKTAPKPPAVQLSLLEEAV